jgi:hypothetical protein
VREDDDGDSGRVRNVVFPLQSLFDQVDLLAIPEPPLIVELDEGERELRMDLDRVRTDGGLLVRGGERVRRGLDGRGAGLRGGETAGLMLRGDERASDGQKSGRDRPGEKGSPANREILVAGGLDSRPDFEGSRQALGGR